MGSRCCGIGRLALLLSVVLPLRVWALSLGEVDLQSQLNQPLQFTLPVLQEGKQVYAAQHVQLKLADAPVYAQHGLDYPAVLSTLVLNVVEGQGLIVQGHSLQKLREPVLYLLFELQWPGGRGLIERSLIVDLPPSYLPAERIISPVAKVVEELTEPVSPERIHTVQRGEVLSLVASEYRGAVDIPLHRYMRALQQLNAQAFPAGLDQLSPGQRIRMPDPQSLLDDSLDTTALPQFEGDVVSYTVQYGDKLSVLAQRFRGNADMPLKQYIQQLVAANPEQLDMSGISLKSGMQLQIPKPEALLPQSRADVPVAEVAAVEKPVELKPVESFSFPPVNTDINAYLDPPVVEEPVALIEPEVEAQPVQTPPPVEVAATEEEQSSSIGWYWLVIALLILFLLGLWWRSRKSQPFVLEELPSLIPPVEQALDNIPVLTTDVDSQASTAELEHDQTVRLNAEDYIQQHSGPAQFSSGEQNDVQRLMDKGDFAQAKRVADRLIYTQPSVLKNWLLKIEVLSKQGKKQHCLTLSEQVHAKFPESTEVDELIQQYFADEEQTSDVVEDEFVPGDYRPGHINAAADLASETAEVQVYLSYGFYDMAQQSLDRLQKDFPRNVELKLLYLEVYLGMGEEALLQDKAAELIASANASAVQQQQAKDLLERRRDMPEAQGLPGMDFDLSDSSESENAAAVDLELDDDDMAYLDSSGLGVDLDLDDAIEEALSREEHHKARE